LVNLIWGNGYHKGYSDGLDMNRKQVAAAGAALAVVAGVVVYKKRRKIVKGVRKIKKVLFESGSS